MYCGGSTEMIDSIETTTPAKMKDESPTLNSAYMNAMVVVYVCAY